ARVAAPLRLVAHVGEQALDAGPQVERAAVRRDDRTAAARVVHWVVGAGAGTALVDGARVLILAAGGRLEGGRGAGAAARIGARGGSALRLHAPGRGGAAIVDRIVDAGAGVAKVVRAGGAVVAVERDPGARPVGAAVAGRARVAVVAGLLGAEWCVRAGVARQVTDVCGARVAVVALERNGARAGLLRPCLPAENQCEDECQDQHGEDRALPNHAE